MRPLPLMLVLLAGCFREPEAAGAVLALQLTDLAGESVAPLEAPRDLELSLSFAGAPDELAPLLLRGRFEAVLLSRLNLAHPNAVLAAQLVALSTERAPHALRSRPTEALAPGRYTLAWPHGSEPAAYPFTVSASPALGARWVESVPGDDATHVPPNLAFALVRFDGHVQGELSTALHGDGFSTRVELCSTLGLPEGDCAWLTPSLPLVPGRHELLLEAGLVTPGGAAVPARRLSFEVAPEADLLAPALGSTVCESDEQEVRGACWRSDERGLQLHGRCDEPCIATLSAGAQRAMAFSYAGELSLQLLPSAPSGLATLRLSDLAGNPSELSFPYARPELAAVIVDEVRADPLGPEPAQEYVELLNFGAEMVSLTGFTLSTDARQRGRPIAAGSLAPGERALLVGPQFDPRDLRDGPLPSDLKLVALDRSLGLANSGGELFLRDASGRRLARARSLAPLVEGQCSHRVGQSLRDDAWELDARGGCTPGADTP